MFKKAEGCSGLPTAALNVPLIATNYAGNWAALSGADNAIIIIICMGSVPQGDFKKMPFRHV